MHIEIVLKHPDAQIPSQAYSGDAGYDLHCLEDGILKPGERRLYKTGVAMAIPKGFYGQIAPRSGWAFKHGLDTLAGVIDSGYRDEIGVILINLGDKNFSFQKGERIAQLIIKRCEQVDFFPVQSFSEKTERGLGGFGSSNV